MPGGWCSLDCHGYLQGDAAFCTTGPSNLKSTRTYPLLDDELNCKEQPKTHWQINPIRIFHKQETLDLKKSAVKQTPLAIKGKTSYIWVSITPCLPLQQETGMPFYLVIICRSKFTSYFETLSICPVSRNEPFTSCSAVKRSTDWAGPPQSTLRLIPAILNDLSMIEVKEDG